MARLALALLGPFRASLGDKPLDGFEYDHVRALLAYVAVERARVHARDALAALVWPDEPERNARQNLRQALAKLRQVIGDRDTDTPLLRIGREQVQVDPGADLEVDVFEFSELVTACDRHGHTTIVECDACGQRLARAVELYRGPFMEGFAFGDKLGFEEWAIVRRRYLQRAALGALAQLAERHARQGDHVGALRCAYRQLELEPWREEAHRQVMNCLAASGDRTAALEQYETCRQVLLDELGVRPSAETTAVYERVRDRAHTSSTPARTLRGGVRGLRAPMTALVGREDDARRLVELLRGNEVRLLTLTGPPGIGKTRLAIQTAGELAPERADGAVFVSLASVDEPDRVADAIARALELRETAGRSLPDAIVDALRDRQVLLVLDNFEHVLAAAPLVSSLLAAAPRLQVIVTSRTVLYLDGEHDYAVPPLGVPELARLPPRDELLACGAVRLFALRARAADARFELTDDNAAAVAEICARLAGLPLAIELAAARVRVLPPRALLGRLSQLALHAERTRDLPARQQSLREAIAWSHDQLDDAERRLFARLSVFAGEPTLEAIEAVGGDTSRDVLDVLASLIDKSLVWRHESADGESRFAMLPMIRELAYEQLARGGDLVPTQARHIRYYVVLAERAATVLEGGPDQVHWFRRLGRERDDVRAAIKWCVEHDPAAALRIATGIGLFWIASGALSEGRASLDAVLAVSGDAPESLRARALWLAGWLALALGDADRARELHGRGFAIAHGAGDTGAMARALAGIGDVALERGDLVAATEAWQRGLALARDADDRWAMMLLLWQLGSAAVERDRSGARALFEECAALAERASDILNRAQAFYYLGGVSLLDGNPRAARDLLEKGLAASEQRWSIFGSDHLAEMLGRALLADRELDRAGELFAASLTGFRETRMRACMAHAFEAFARLALARGEPERGARLLGASGTSVGALELTMRPIERALYEQTRDAVRAALGPTQYTEAEAEGAAMAFERIIAYALGLVDRSAGALRGE